MEKHLETIKQHGGDYRHIIIFLHFTYPNTVAIPEDIKDHSILERLVDWNILIKNYNDQGEVVYKSVLHESEDAITVLAKEVLELWKDKASEIGATGKTSTVKKVKEHLSLFLLSNPKYNEEDIVNGVNFYLDNFKSKPVYLKRITNFIEEALEIYIDEYYSLKDNSYDVWTES